VHARASSKKGPSYGSPILGRATLHGSHTIVQKTPLLVPSLRFVGHAGTEGARQSVQSARGKSRPGRPQEAWQGTHAESRRPVARRVKVKCCHQRKAKRVKGTEARARSKAADARKKAEARSLRGAKRRRGAAARRTVGGVDTSAGAKQKTCEECPTRSRGPRVSTGPSVQPRAPVEPTLLQPQTCKAEEERNQGPKRPREGAISSASLALRLPTNTSKRVSGPRRPKTCVW
jgi:hypothetical protein